jgi:hypothetical protein
VSLTKPRAKDLIARHQLMIETIALLAILIVPLFLYLAAEAGLETLVSLLLGFMCVLMLAAIRLI